MPIERLTIDRVDEWPGQHQEPTVFIVKGRTTDDPLGFRTLITLSAWRASLCQEAAKSQATLVIAWQDAGAYLRLKECRRESADLLAMEKLRLV